MFSSIETFLDKHFHSLGLVVGAGIGVAVNVFLVGDPLKGVGFGAGFILFWGVNLVGALVVGYLWKALRG